MIIKSIPAGDDILLNVSDVLKLQDFHSLSKYFSNIFPGTSGASVDASDRTNPLMLRLRVTLSTLEKIIIDNVRDQVRLTGFSLSKNRYINLWHKHRKEYKSDPDIIFNNKMYVAVFYFHEIWDESAGGKLAVGFDQENPLAEFYCNPNSCVIHSANMYHGVGPVSMDRPTRIVMYSHWVPQ